MSRGVSKTDWVQALAQVLRGYHHMGLVPSRLEDVPSDWDKLTPAQRERWERYAVQVRNAVELVQVGEGARKSGYTVTLGAGGARAAGLDTCPFGSVTLVVGGGVPGGNAGSVKFECTGLAASWCPIHGPCSCPRNEGGERIEQSDDCPLHGRGSLHAE